MLFNFTITLGKSKSYLQVASLIHVFAVVMLWHASLPVYLSCGLLLVLILSFIPIARNNLPVPAFHQLSYHQDHWVLHGIHGQTLTYKQARIGFDAGLFIWLTLTDDGASKKLLIFRDQLTTPQYRALNLVGAIHPKS